MATCKRIVGNWIPHPCGGEIRDGRCRRCGGAAGEGPPPPAAKGSPPLELELEFSEDELDSFGVLIAGEADAHPSEWGADAFSDLT